MNQKMPTSLDLEVDEIESRERTGRSCTSSSTRAFCTCACKLIPGDPKV